MARLWKYNSEEEGETEPNFEVRERNGRRYLVWDENLDVIAIDEEELEVLAEALGYKLTALAS